MLTCKGSLLNKGRRRNWFQEMARSTRYFVFLRTEQSQVTKARKFCAITEKLSAESNGKSALDNSASPAHVQDTILSLPGVCINAGKSQDYKAPNPDNSFRRHSFQFASIVLTTIRPELHPKPSVELISEPFPFTEKETGVVFTTRQSHKVLFVYRVTGNHAHRQ